MGKANVSFQYVNERERWVGIEDGSYDVLITGTPAMTESFDWSVCFSCLNFSTRPANEESHCNLTKRVVSILYLNRSTPISLSLSLNLSYLTELALGEYLSIFAAAPTAQTSRTSMTFVRI